MTRLLPLVAALVALLSAAPALATDLNCNGIEERDEPLTDPNDPLCGSPNADYYVMFDDFGCLYPVVPSNDPDGDGYGSGPITVTVCIMPPCM